LGAYLLALPQALERIAQGSLLTGCEFCNWP
jgi:hypothetical protein